MPSLKKVFGKKAAMAERVQCAALPYRTKADGGLEILLVTSRDTGRWIVPKGWPKKGISASESAAEEAYEEAGVEGAIGAHPLGSYSYDKILRNDKIIRCTVRVFALAVTRQHDEWPEKHERQAAWHAPAAAAACVQEPGLRRIIRRFGAKR